MLALLLAALCFNLCESLRGGNPVSPVGSFPWMAMVERMRFGRPQLQCGGALITNTHVLTAARCLEFHISEYRISLGVHDRVNRAQGEPTRYELSSYVRHPLFIDDRGLGHPNDICVARLLEPANVGSPYITPIAMPADDNRNPPEFLGNDCFMAGWGNVGPYGPLMDEMHEARVDVLEQDACQLLHPQYPMDRMHICVWDIVTQRVSSCEGDEGTPLMCNVGGTWMLAGINSWRGIDCDTDRPTVYSRISHYRPWIDEQAGTGP